MDLSRTLRLDLCDDRAKITVRPYRAVVDARLQCFCSSFLVVKRMKIKVACGQGSMCSGGADMRGEHWNG